MVNLFLSLSNFVHIYSEEGIQTFEDLFLYACPKFISPNGPNFEDPNTLTQTIVRNKYN